EAVAWRRGRLYLTEDFDIGNPEQAVAFYRYTPAVRPRRPGDLARSGGKLEALRIRGRPDADLRSGVPVGRPMPVRWVTIDDPDPPVSPVTGGVRQQAFAKGAARFTREEGTAVDGPRIYFDCTNGGDAELGQIWEYHAGREELTLIYESPSQKVLDFPDNLTVAPTGDLFICENGTPPDFIRGLTPGGRIVDFAQAVNNLTEFAGACFSADGKTLFVNQNGDRDDQPGVTYAIWGPFASRRPPDDGNGRPRDRRPRGDDPGGGGGSAGDAGNDGAGGGEVATTGGGGGTGTAGSGDLDPGAAADVSVALEDDGLPLTGLPLLTSAGAAAILLATGAVLRRRLDNARARAEGASSGGENTAE
ncbi:MAG: alkaline phosphatase PhoX, partial [Thermoleophilaceae bacterium]